MKLVFVYSILHVLLDEMTASGGGVYILSFSFNRERINLYCNTVMIGQFGRGRKGEKKR